MPCRQLHRIHHFAHDGCATTSYNCLLKQPPAGNSLSHFARVLGEIRISAPVKLPISHSKHHCLHFNCQYPGLVEVPTQEINLPTSATSQNAKTTHQMTNISPESHRLCYSCQVLNILGDQNKVSQETLVARGSGL